MPDINLAYIDKRAWLDLVKKLNRSDNLLVFNFLVLVLTEYHATKELKITFTKQQLRERLGLEDNNLFQRIYNACEILKGTVVRYEDDDKIEPISILQSCPIYKNKRVLELVIDERFRFVLEDLHSFLKIREAIARCKPTAVLFYSLLKSIHSDNVYSLQWETINDYCNLSFTKYAGFKQKFLLPTIETIKANANIHITCKEKKIGKKIVGLSFEINESEICPDEPVIEETLTTKIKPKDESKEPVVKDTMNKDIEAVYNHYLKTFLKTPKEYRLTPNRKAKIKARLKEFSLEDLLKAIDNVTLDKWEKRPEYRDLEKHIFKSFEATEKWINFETEPKKVIPVKSLTASTDPMDNPKFKEEYDRLISLGHYPAFARARTYDYMRTGERFEVSKQKTLEEQKEGHLLAHLLEH